MRFGIIIATFQSGNTLRRCLQSVFAQENAECKVVVIDGGSNDETIAILKEYGEQIHHWKSEPDRGIYDAWNKALPLVSDCDWICFLGADDQLAAEDVLARARERMLALPSKVLFAYGRLLITDAAGNVLEQRGTRWSLCSKLASVQIPIPHTATFHRFEAFARFGEFDSTFRIAGDYDFLLRAGLLPPPHFMEDLVVSMMQKGGLSSNRLFELKALREFVRARRKNRFKPYVGFVFSWVYAKAAIKYLLFRLVGSALTDKIVTFYRFWTRRAPLSRNKL